MATGEERHTRPTNHSRDAMAIGEERHTRPTNHSRDAMATGEQRHTRPTNHSRDATSPSNNSLRGVDSTANNQHTNDDATVTALYPLGTSRSARSPLSKCKRSNNSRKLRRHNSRGQFPCQHPSPESDATVPSTLNTSTSLAQQMDSLKVPLRTIPHAQEVAFYVAVESCQSVRDNWDAVVKGFTRSSKTHQPDGTLGAHAQLVYNSTQGHLGRLGKMVESVKEQRQRDLPSFDPQYFIPIYNFYKHEKSRFYEVLQAEAKQQRWSAYDNVNSLAYQNYKMFDRLVKIEAMTELVLDSAFNGRVCQLPKCIFTLSNLQRLSLCENNLRSLPADVGRLGKLRILELSRNRLKNDSIPYTLSYCKEITTLHIDYNVLDAVPGFVLELKNLKTLHRHGNQNYFRSTFMWYGCESRERIRTASFSDVDVAAVALTCATQVQSAKFWAARTIISSKANYFLLPSISETVKDYISEVYTMFNICAACHTACLLHSQGYFVFTFHNPFVGNTCVPFQHWTCSKECALTIEIPARRQQIRMARQQQKMYDSHVRLYSRQPDTILEQTTVDSIAHCQTSRERRKRLRCHIM